MICQESSYFLFFLQCTFLANWPRCTSLCAKSRWLSVRKDMRFTFKPHENLIITSYNSHLPRLIMVYGLIKSSRFIVKKHVYLDCCRVAYYKVVPLKVAWGYYEVIMRFLWGLYEVFYNTSYPFQPITIGVQRHMRYIFNCFAKFNI